MRDSKSFNFPTFCSLSNSKLGLLTVLPALALTFGLLGCSKMANQQTSFHPIATPSMSAEQNQSVQNILARQDAIRKQDAMQVAAEKAAAEAEEDLTSAQQEEIVNNAAIRATNSEDEAVPATPFEIAQVSYETEIDESEDQESETADVALENVRLTANVDDLENVPQNIARAAFPFSGGNLLRDKPAEVAQAASLTAKVEDDLVDAASTTDVIRPSTVATQTPAPLQFPLQPMLFNPKTRVTKTNVEGTLRPLKTTPQEIEPEVVIERAEPDNRSNAGLLTPLQPSNKDIIKLTTNRVADVSNDFVPSRLLSPIDRSATPFAERPEVEAAVADTVAPAKTPEVAPNDFKPIRPLIQSPAPLKASKELVVSEQIIIVDPNKTPPVRSESMIASELGPIVDENLANAKATYLQTIPNSFVPAEVFPRRRRTGERRRTRNSSRLRFRSGRSNASTTISKSILESRWSKIMTLPLHNRPANVSFRQ